MAVTGQALATAWISIVPSLKGAGAAISKEMGGPGASKAIESSGKSLGGKLGTGLKVGAAATGVAVAGILTAALAKGFKRLSTIEEAKASLEGLGHSSGTVTEIMKNALTAVKGTAFGMGEAATAAAGAVAAGVPAGKELERTLKLVGDAATIGKTDIGSMGAIFNKIASSGKVTGRELNQLNMQGIPIVQLLGKEMGKTSGEITKMVSKGEVDFETFQNAIEKGMGGAALTSGATVSGAFANMGAALGRLGASMLESVFPLFGQGFNLVTKGLDAIESKVGPVAKKLGGELGDALSQLGKGFSMPSEEASKLGGSLTFLEGVGVKLMGAVREVRGGFIALGSGFIATGDDITSAGFAGVLEAIGLGLGNIWKQAGPAFEQLLPGLIDLWAAFSPLGIAIEALVPLIPELGDVAGTLAAVLSGVLLAGLEAAVPLIEVMGIIAQDVVVPALEALVPILQDVATWMSENTEMVALLTGAYVSVKLAMGGYKIAAGWVILLNQGVEKSLANTKVQIILSWLAMGKAALVSAAETAYVWWLYKVESIKAVAAMAVAKAKIVGHWVVMGVQSMLAGAKIAAAWVLAMGPVGWIIAGIAALVGGFIAAYQNIGWFRDGVDAALRAVGGFFVNMWEKGIKPAFGWIVDALKNTGQWFKDVWDGAALAVESAVQWIMDAAGSVASFFDTYVAQPIRVAIDAVAAAFTWWYETVTKPIFDAVFNVVNGFYLGFRGIFQLVVSVFRNLVAPAFRQFWEGTVKPVFNAVLQIIDGWWTKTKAIFDIAVAVIKGTFSAAFTFLRDSVVTPVFDFIKKKIDTWWTGVKFIFDTVILFIRTTLNSAFTWLRDSVIVPVFNFIKAKIDSWWSGVKFVFDVAVAFIRGVLSTAFTWLRDSVITPVFNGIKWAVETWWAGVKFIFDTVVGFIYGTLSSAFTWFRDSVINPVWNGIRDTISNVWNNGIKPVFDFLSNAIKNDVPNAFQKGVDGVKSIWETLLDIAKSPVRFVVNTVINDGLIGAFNKVAGILPGIDQLARVALPAGFRDGGYTGDYGYDTAVGVVHGNEHVIRAESRKSIESKAPGLLDSLNQFGAGALAKLGYRNGGRVNPTGHMGLTQGYSDAHKGIDIGVGVGTPVFSAEDGRVTHAGPGARAPGVWGGQEVHVLGGGVEQWFAHLSQIGVKVGQMVTAGQQIALSGNTGISSGPHLHYGTFNGGWPNSFNPLPWLSGASAPEGGDKGGGWLDPFGALIRLADGVMAKVKAAIPGGGFMVDAAAGIGKKIITDIVGWGKGKLGMGAVMGSPTLFDGGGWLENTGRPQLIDHQRRKPDAVLTNEQWAMAEKALTGGDDRPINFYGNVGWDPNEVAERIETKRRDTFAAYGI